ncbi:MAG: glycosyltransferase family 87 protein, partial [Geodermatophilaceae bacterium]
RRPWDAAMVALSPLLFVHAFTNWDLWAIALSSAGLVAWSRRNPALAGVLLGLAISAKLYPLLFLGVLFVLCLRAGRLREFGLTTVASLVTWAAINVPVALAAPENWSLFFRLNQTRTADPDSLWRIAEHISGSTGASLFDPVLAPGTAPTGLNLAVALATAAVCAGVAFVGLRAPVRPRLPQLLFLLLAGFLLVNKVWSPQFSLWLLPLAVLARPEWRLLLAWQAAEAFLWGPRLLWYLGLDNSGIRIEWFFLAVGIRDVLVIALMLYVLRDLWDPRWDIVRRSGMDDPAGGVLDGAPDRFPDFLRRMSHQPAIRPHFLRRKSLPRGAGDTGNTVDPHGEIASSQPPVRGP